MMPGLNPKKTKSYLLRPSNPSWAKLSKTAKPEKNLCLILAEAYWIPLQERKGKLNMKKPHSIVLFNQKRISRFYDEEKEIWYFSIIDIIEILTDSSIPKRYWSDLKGKLKNEGSEVYEKIVRLKMAAPDGKQRETDCFSTPHYS